MKIIVEGLRESADYDERNLNLCTCDCGKRLISKKMFKEFLEKNYSDIDATVHIYTVRNVMERKLKTFIEIIQDT